MAQPWAATIADRLYERQLLNADGRDVLKQRIATQQLAVDYELPGSNNRFVYRQVGPATVLAFCVQAFQAEFAYRTIGGRGDELSSDLYIAGQAPPDSAAIRAARQRFTQLLQAVHGDTAALFRQLASPGQLLEEKIPAEDSLIQTGWTIFPPLGRPDSLPHPIADSRSVFGKTRTRTARDLYELGLVTSPQYAVLRRELAGGELTADIAVCERAAQLALDAVTYSTRRAAFDSLQTRLTAAGVLPPAGRAHLLADSLALRSLAPFDLLPYCIRTRVMALDSLPADAHQRYPRLLAAVAAIWPAFRYADVQVRVHEKRRFGSREQLATLAFRAGGRRYAATFVEDYNLDLPRYPATRQRPLHYLPDELVSLLNQYLRDQGSPMRLYLASPENDPTLTDMREALLLLTPAQRAAWGPASQLLDGPPQPDTLFTSARIERALTLYQRLGLLAGLSAAELAEGREQALSGTVSSYAALLACFPRLVVYTGGEDAEQPQAYAHALRQVAAATRGAFRPTRIHDTFAGETGRKQHSSLSFVAGGRHYRTALVSDLGWMINNFTDLVQRAVRETTSGQLYYLGYGDETGLYLFLTAAQAATLRRAQPALFREHDAEAAHAQHR
jgi:hypothetical protein